MQKYVCAFCGYEYDPEVGDPDRDYEFLERVTRLELATFSLGS